MPNSASDVVYSDYWVAHLYEINEDFLDFKKSIFLYEKKRDDFSTSYLKEDIEIKFSSKEEFQAHEKNTKGLKEITTIIKPILTDHVTEDFFALGNVEGGIGYFVSETLKNEIENAGCTGIEFQPSELSFNEWTAGGGSRDQVYGRSW